jgi:hypothetical protein
MGPIEYGRYKERLERRGAKYEGVNLHHLCANASDAIGRVNGAFRDVLFEALIIGPRIAVEEIDPKTISRFHAHLKGMEELEQLLVRLSNSIKLSTSPAMSPRMSRRAASQTRLPFGKQQLSATSRHIGRFSYSRRQRTRWKIS